MKSKKILYISYTTSTIATAQSINVIRRKTAMKLAGYDVVEFRHSPHRGFADFFPLLQILRTVDIICIRIDGSRILDKFSLLKCFYWNRKILWEIHGFPHENATQKKPGADLKRWIFSSLADGYVYVSSELKQFAAGKIFPKTNQIIPNFVLPQELARVRKLKSSPIQRYLEQPVFFKVVWAGNTALHWQATNLIEKVAQNIYKQDPSIIFLIIGNRDQKSTFKWHDNILMLGRLPREQTLQIISSADMGLALYHKPPYTPFYFVPLKILDYFMLKKPVIATKTATIESLIQHNLNGLLTNNTISDITKKILLLRKDAHVAKSLRKQAFKDIHTYHTVQRAIPLYQKLLSTL